MLTFLGLFALIDMTFSSFREAMGRNFLINKKRYYRFAMLLGALLAATLLGALALIFKLFLAFSANNDRILIGTKDASQAPPSRPCLQHVLKLQCPRAA